MKRPHPHLHNRLTLEQLKPIAHLSRRMIGKRHEQHPIARQTLAQYVGHPMQQRPRLARASPRQDQQGAAVVLDGCTLRWVEFVKSEGRHAEVVLESPRSTRQALEQAATRRAQRNKKQRGS